MFSTPAEVVAPSVAAAAAAGVRKRQSTLRSLKKEKQSLRDASHPFAQVPDRFGIVRLEI